MSVGQQQLECRRHIADEAGALWSGVMEHDPDGVELPAFVADTMRSGEWGGAEQIAIFAAVHGVQVSVHELDGGVQTFGKGGKTVRLLYSNAAYGHGNPDHYDLIWAKSDTEGETWDTG